jgi:hypothetical protein
MVHAIPPAGRIQFRPPQCVCARAWMSRKYDALFVACCNLLERIREVSQIRLGIDILFSMATDDEKFADL